MSMCGLAPAYSTKISTLPPHRLSSPPGRKQARSNRTVRPARSAMHCRPSAFNFSSRPAPPTVPTLVPSARTIILAPSLPGTLPLTDATVQSANGVLAPTSSAAWRITRNDSSIRALLDRDRTARCLVRRRSGTRDEQAACVVLGRVHVDQDVRRLALDVGDLVPRCIDHGPRGRLVGEQHEGGPERRIEEHRVTAPAVVRRYEDAPTAAARPPGGEQETELRRAHQGKVRGIQEERLGLIG